MSPGFSFTANQIVHIFSHLLEFILLLGEQGYCHSDLKPENVTLVPVEGDIYVAKVIDFGVLSKNQLKTVGYTPNYFLNPRCQYDETGEIVFKDMEDRFKNEFFTVARTI